MAPLPMNEILHGDVLERIKNIPDESTDCILTSPPYWGLLPKVASNKRL